MVSVIVCDATPVLVDRPNTVSGLVAKRSELLRHRKGLEAELRKVTCDIDHLDAAIALFDPEATPRALQRYATKHRARRGQLKTFVIERLREAVGPITSKDITLAWVSARGLKTDDATFVLLRKRVGACLTAIKADGVVTGVPMEGDYKGWSLTTKEATHRKLNS